MVVYHRFASEAPSTSDVVFIGNPVVYGETIDGGVVTGSAFAYTVESDGPVDASGSDDCVTPPVGFVVETGDQVTYRDFLRVGLACHVTLSDVCGVSP